MKPPHQESLLSEVEFERLLNAAASTHSFETLSETIVYARGPACQPTQYLRIVSMMYHKLDANKIPYRIINDDGVTINELSEALDFAFTSLIGLGTTMRIWLTKVNQQDFRQQLAKGLRAHWPEIRQWVLFLYRSIIVQDDLDIDLRHICKKAVLEFLGLIRDDRLRVWSKSVPTDREVMKVISDLWFLEIRDPRFSSWDSMVINQRESAVFGTCLLMAFELGVSIDWENILSVFLRDPELIAKVSLCHLEGEISHGDELDLFCITCDLQIISVLSQLENIRLALMRQGVVKAAAEILALIVGREWKGEMQMDALPFLSQALEPFGASRADLVACGGPSWVFSLPLRPASTCACSRLGSGTEVRRQTLKKWGVLQGLEAAKGHSRRTTQVSETRRFQRARSNLPE
ncbi:hypothetical protein L210DRAFT_2791086 [Boletus edulis BED1]|uniref:Uncharacterized protein n=1 Tax=Boletus edulis BED1 TaxID=1328754 RepID=A0AAD4GJ08_BOLED|nr:hypothetical protein L210DRAFT_2791086 [Boletus edulis BED1]